MREEARVLRRAAVFLRERRPAGHHLDQPDLHDEVVAVLADGADDQAVGAKLLPPVERQFGDRRRLRNAPVRVARDQIELALEVQVVPQDLSHRLCGADGLGIIAKR